MKRTLLALMVLWAMPAAAAKINPKDLSAARETDTCLRSNAKAALNSPLLALEFARAYYLAAYAGETVKPGTEALGSKMDFWTTHAELLRRRMVETYADERALDRPAPQII